MQLNQESDSHEKKPSAQSQRRKLALKRRAQQNRSNPVAENEETYGAKYAA